MLHLFFLSKYTVHEGSVRAAYIKMLSADRYIASCVCWDDFWERAKNLSNAEKGIAFERLTQLYLQTVPEYRTKLQYVWLLRDIPADIRHRINLPGPRDEGIDLIGRTREGQYWAIQAKFRSEPDKPRSADLRKLCSDRRARMEAAWAPAPRPEVSRVLEPCRCSLRKHFCSS